MWIDPFYSRCFSWRFWFTRILNLLKFIKNTSPSYKKNLTADIEIVRVKNICKRIIKNRELEKRTS